MLQGDSMIWRYVQIIGLVCAILNFIIASIDYNLSAIFGWAVASKFMISDIRKKE